MGKAKKIVEEERTDEEMVAEYLSNGGKITTCEPFARTENVEYRGAFWGKRKKVEAPVTDTPK
tara:strand:- start:40 stop:228 length:189 start_codon:yes stop_codon:yes gene_type:complete